MRRLIVFRDGFKPLPLDFGYAGIFAIIVTAMCVVLSWRYLNKQGKKMETKIEFPFFM